MKVTSSARLPLGGGLAVAILLCLASLPAGAQVSGPITTQSLFFDQGSGAHHGDYLEAQAGFIYTDNVNLEPNGPGDELAMIGLVGNTERQGAPRFDYHLDSDLLLVKYFGSQYQTQPLGYLDGTADFKIFPGTLSWIARDSFSQASINQIGPPTPDNLESINYVTTGPQLLLKPTLQTTITLTGDYSNVYSSSKSPEYVNINSNRFGGDLRLDHAFSNILTAYITGTYQKVRFQDTDINTDFEYRQGDVGFKINTERTVLDASIGYTLAHLDAVPPPPFPPPRIHGYAFFPMASDVAPAATTSSQNDESPSGVDWHVDLSRLISPRQRLSIHALRQVTDAANLFRLNLDQPVPGNQSQQLATGQPFTYTEFGGNWTYDTGRTRFMVGAIDFTNRYALTPQTNHDGKQLNAFATRKLNESLLLETGASFEHDNYSALSQNTWTVLASLRWHVGPRVSVRFIYAHSTLTNSYSENQVGITAAYALTRGAQAPDELLQPVSGASQPLLR
jgi:hypothetical protein